MMNIYKKLTVIGFVILTIVVNYLSNAIPFNNKTTAEISNNLSTILTPPGYVFSIWGLIYLMLLIHSIYPFFAKKINPKIYNRILPWVVISCIANMSWIYVWHYEYLNLTLIVMIILLISLIYIYKIIGINKKRNLIQRIILEWPFSFYLGWIYIASLLNLTIVLKHTGIGLFGLPELVWSIFIILLLTVINVFVLIKRRDYIFSLVTFWALFGIWNKPDNEIPFSTILAAFIAILATLYVVSKKIKSD